MADEPLLSRRREWWGRWWLPNAPDRKFSGVLEFDPEAGILLRMVGGFEYRVFDEPAAGIRTYSGETRRWPVVFGQAENRGITLLDCGLASAKSFLGGDEPETLHLHAQTILDGCWLNDPSEAIFVRASASIENLTWWSPHSTVSGTIQFPKEGESGPTTGQMHVAPVEPLSAAMPGVTIGLDHTYTLPHLEPNRSETVARIRDWAVLDATFDAPVPLDETLAPVEAVRDLLSLSTSDACGLIWQRVWLKPQSGVYPEGHPLAGKPHKVDCYRHQQVVAAPDAKPPGPDELLVSLKDAAFAEIVPRWFAVRKQFQAASNIVLGMRYNASGYLESRVTSAVGAAEAFHRALKPPPPIPQAEFRKIRKELLAVIDTSHRNWLGGILSRNEPSLRVRLLDLVARLDMRVSTILLPTPKKWADATTNARNTLAHTGRSSKHTLEELYAVSEVTNAVVILNLLQELGVSGTGVAERMKRNRILGRAVRLAEEYFR